MDGAGASAFRSPALTRLLVGAACLLYAGQFGAASSHSQWFVYPLIPDEVVLSTFGGEQLEFALIDRLPAASLAAIAAVISQGIGFAGLSVLGLQFELRRGERIGMGFAIGSSALSTWTLAIGTLVGLGAEWLILAPPTLVALAGWWLEHRRPRRSETGRLKDADVHAVPLGESKRSDGESKRSHGERVRPEGDDTNQTWWRWAWLPFAILVLLGAILPPWEFDVLEYHLQVPKEWHQAGRIEFLPHNVYGNMPLGAEMAALWSMTLAVGDEAWFHGALAGKVLNGLFTIGVALAVGSMATRESGPRAGALASVLFLSTPWILHTTMAGLVDSVLAGYTLFAFGAWYRARPEALARASLAWITLAGWMAGAAAGTKYTGVVFAILPIAAAILFQPLLAIWRAWRSSSPTVALGKTVACVDERSSLTRGMRFALVRLAVFLAAAAISGGGWYAKNWGLAGNPVYPLLAGVSGPGLETAEQRWRWSQAHRPGGASVTEWRSAYGPRELLSSAAQLGWRSPWQSPLLPPLVLFALVFLRPRSERLRWIGPPLWILMVWWLATHRIDRFWIPALPFAVLLASQGTQVLDVLFGRRWVDCGLVAMFGWLLLMGAGPGSADEPFANNRFFVSLAASRQAQTHPAHRWLNENVPATGKVLLVGDARPFYLRRPALYNTCFDRDALSTLVADPSSTARRAAFRAAGITHVFVDWSELARYRSPGNYGHTSVATPALIHGELVERQRLLRPIAVADEALAKSGGEIFEVLENDSSVRRADGDAAVR